MALILTIGKLAELELIREKFSKLLLGEDMSGSGKGVCTAVAISNAITNLYGKEFNIKISFHTEIDEFEETHTRTKIIIYSDLLIFDLS